MPALDQLKADLTSKDEPRAESAAVRFVSLGEEGFQALRPLTNHPDEDIRWWALRAISEFDRPEVADILITGMQDPSPDVQACAALALRLHPDARAIPYLMPLLGTQDSVLSRVAGDALAAIGKPATPALIEIIDRESTSHKTKLEAVRVLAEVKDTAAISTLFKVFQEGSSMMQHWAEKGLDALGIGMVFFNPG